MAIFRRNSKSPLKQTSTATLKDDKDPLAAAASMLVNPQGPQLPQVTPPLSVNPALPVNPNPVQGVRAFSSAPRPGVGQALLPPTNNVVPGMGGNYGVGDPRAQAKPVPPAPESAPLPATETPEQEALRLAVEQLMKPSDVGNSRQALQEELANSQAENIQSVRARTGLAGMGLTGAAAAAEGTERRRGSREAALTLAEFDKSSRAEEAGRLLQGIQASLAVSQNELNSEIARANAEYERIAFQAALDEVERKNNVDYDENGVIGNGQENSTQQQAEDLEKATEALRKKNKNMRSADLVFGDEDTEPGTQQEPYIHVGNIVSLTKYLGENGALPLEKFEYNGRTTFRDALGNYYVLDRGGEYNSSGLTGNAAAGIN